MKFRKRRAGKLVVILPVVIVFGAAAAWAGVTVTSKKSSPTAQATTRTVQVTDGTISQTVSASGTLAPADTEDLSFSSSGTVTAVGVKAGQKVKKGQVLATIDSASLKSQVVQAEAQVAAAKSTLSSDTSAGASSAQLAADSASLASDRAQYASAVTALEGSNLVSPIAGTVSTVNLTVGQQLGSSGGSGTGLGNPSSSAASSAASSATASSSTEIEVVSSSLVVNLSVDDTEIGRLKVGQAATVSVSSSSTSSASGTAAAGAGAAAQPSATSGSSGIAGKVTSVGTIASASSGVASFPVVVAVTGSTSGLFSGATASVVVTYHQLSNVLVAPSLAVSQSQGSSWVTVSANGKQTKTKVTTGLSSGGQVEITSGLRAGQEVVITIPAAVARRTTGGNGSGAGGFPTGGFGGGGFGGGGGFTPPAGAVPGGAGQ